MLKSLKRTPADRVLTPAELALQVRFGDVCRDKTSGCLVWLEQRWGKGVLVVWDPASGARRDLTTEVSVRASWGYGGGDFGVGNNCVFFISGGDLFSQRLDQARPAHLLSNQLELASPVASPDSASILLIDFAGGRDRLRTLSSDGTEASVVDEGCDFLMQPTWSPDGGQLAWVGWNHPNMPWDGSGLFLADRDSASKPLLVRGEPGGGEAIFQPTFSPDGSFLSLVSDKSGWSNLIVLSRDGDEVARFADDAEHAPPAWIQGLRSHVWSEDSRTVFVVRSRDGVDTLARFEPASGLSEGVALPGWTSVSQPTLAQKGHLAMVASAPDRPPAIISLNLETGAIETLRTSLPTLHRPTHHTGPEPLRWGEDGEECFGLFYAPTSPATNPPPAVLRVHGGPTSQYRAEFESDVHFFCSRGIAVFDVNYRGSSGYGRAYRRSLDKRWGELDVLDLCAAAGFLASTGRADSKRLVAAGGSAGGLTVLLALAKRPGLFSAAICRYAVSDLLSLAAQTHRFERSYLERLVGRLPQEEEIYRERSPLRLADQIRDPVALFQGGQDRVVPQQQTAALVNVLRDNGVPHIYRFYEAEGHGWRRAETIADYYETVDLFLRTHVLS